MKTVRETLHNCFIHVMLLLFRLFWQPI